MDWTAIIEKNRNALMRILGMLVTMANIVPHPEALASGEPQSTLPRHLHRTILRLLRPAEAATRRLVIIAARDVVVTLPPPRKRRPKPTSIFVRNGKGTGIVLPRGVKPETILPGLVAPRPPRRSFALPLTDRLPGWPRPHRSPVGVTLRISVPGFSEPDRSHDHRRPPLPGDPVDATRLTLRLNAVGRALDNLLGEARRFARWWARATNAAALDRNRAAAASSPPSNGGEVACEAGRSGGRTTRRVVRLWPLRPGRPPGSLRRPTHEIHEVLADLQYFATAALERRDIS